MLPVWNATAVRAPDNSHLDSVPQLTKGFCLPHPIECSQKAMDKGKVAEESVGLACGVSPGYTAPLAFNLGLILELVFLPEPRGRC